MSNNQNEQVIVYQNDNAPDTQARQIPSENHENNENQENNEQKAENIENSPLKKKYLIMIIVGIIVLIVVLVIIIAVVVTKKKKKKDENGSTFYQEINENNYAKTSMKDNLSIPSDKKLQVVGADFQYKNTTLIIGKNNKAFRINNDGKIEGITKDDFPLSYSFNETIINGSYLFKDVKCFKAIDLSKMDSSKLIDASNMFENSDFEEIYFGNETEQNSTETRYLEENPDFNSTEEEFLEEEEPEEEKRKGYFDTTNIESAANMFSNCVSLKKVQLPPSFNVGKNAKGLFKGCTKLNEVNTSLISSTEIEEMDSMFEDCRSLKEISFSNDFLTGEVKTLVNVFKNIILNLLDISYLRLYNLKSSENIFDGASINGNLKLGKYYSNDNIRDNLFKEIAKVTDSTTRVFTPSGTTIDQVFQNIYQSEKNTRIAITVIDIDYNIRYKEDADYKLYSNKLHFGLGWDFDRNNTYDLDSSVVTFNSSIDHLEYVYFSHLQAYNGTVNHSGDDLTGEGEGDDEEIRVSLDLLPSEVQMFTVQLNSYRGNSLKDVKSAYIRISTDLEVIGTYSITDAGDNIGLLIGCFFKNPSNEWYFKPLNEIIPGNVVISSIPSIKEYLNLIFNNKLISAKELVNRLMYVANGNSTYSQKKRYNSLYWNGTHFFADCSNLIKSIINGRDVYNPKKGTYQNKFPVVEDVNANGLIAKCNNVSTDFNALEYGVPRLLHLKDNQGNGHVGIYLGQTLYKENGNVNVIESTTSWGANAVIYSWVDDDGTRRFYEGGPLSEMKYNWTSHGSLSQWVW